MTSLLPERLTSLTGRHKHVSNLSSAALLSSTDWILQLIIQRGVHEGIWDWLCFRWTGWIYCSNDASHPAPSASRETRAGGRLSHISQTMCPIQHSHSRIFAHRSGVRALDCRAPMYIFYSSLPLVKKIGEQVHMNSRRDLDLICCPRSCIPIQWIRTP